MQNTQNTKYRHNKINQMLITEMINTEKKSKNALELKR